MANNKEIKFKAVLDESGMDAGIQRLQQKMAQMQKTNAMLTNINEQGGNLSPAARQAQSVFQKTSQSILQREKRELENKQRDEMRYLQQKERQLDKLKKIEQSLTDAQKEKLKALEEEVNLRSQNAIQRDQQIGDIDKRLGAGGAGGGFGGGAGGVGAGGLKGLMSRIMKSIDPKMLLNLAGGVATGVSMYSGYLGIQQTRERELMGNQGSAVQSGNIGFQNTMRGRGFMNFFEQSERAKAFDAAMKERDIRLQRDPMSAIGSALGKGAAGALGGSFIGGPLGTVIGGLAGAGSELFNKNTFNMMFDRERYQADVTADTFKNFRTNLQAQRLLNPEKYAGQEQFLGRASRFQGLQRQLGLSDRDLLGDVTESFKDSSEYSSLGPAPTRRMANKRSGRGARMEYTESEEDFNKRLNEYNQKMYQREAQFNQRQQGNQLGFLERNMTDRYGQRSFSEERIMENLKALSGSGASSSFMRGRGAGMAAEYQRAGFTNAAGELGRISGLGGSGEQTEQAYLRLISEAMTIGINQSDMPEETRRFTKMATQLFVDTAGSEGAVRVLGQGMVGTDMSSMQAARGMFDRVNQESGQSTGYRGALKQSFLQSKKGRGMFGQLDENLRQTLTEMDVKSLDVDNPFIREAARQQGVTPEEMISSVREMQRFGENLSGDTDKARQNLTKKFKSSGMSKQDYFSSEGGNSELVNFLSSYGMERDGIGRLNRDQLESLGGFAVAGDMTGLKGAMDKMDLKGGARGADKAEASRAGDQVAQLSVINDTLVQLKDSFDKNAEMTVEKLKETVLNVNVINELENIRKESGDEGVSRMLRGLYESASGVLGDAPSASKGRN